MEYTHLTFSILNLLGFIILGIAWAYILKREWKRLKNISVKKFVYIAGFASTIGGLIGFLINGAPDAGVSTTNMIIASAFAILSIVFYSNFVVKTRKRTNI